METAVFLLGAGFSSDAAAEAGWPVSQHGHVRYPLVSDLLKPCFGLESLPPGQSIEELFEESIDRHDRRPVGQLYETVMEADFTITPHLRPNGSHADNVYLRFLADFGSEPLLTFNYDSLVELLLLGQNRWRPDDGYGVPVRIQPLRTTDPSAVTEKSLRHVLHLHGSLCVYPQGFSIVPQGRNQLAILRPKDPPDFIFDPESESLCFLPFEGRPAGISYVHVPERAIAPVPDKAKGLLGHFIKEMYRQAVDAIRSADRLLVIGYSFNPHDRASYERLLAPAKGRTIVIVDPNANHIAHRMRMAYPTLHWQEIPYSFRDWVRAGYPGAERYVAP